jgi:hypothetical protein
MPSGDVSDEGISLQIMAHIISGNQHGVEVPRNLELIVWALSQSCFAKVVLPFLAVATESELFRASIVVLQDPAINKTYKKPRHTSA